MNKRPMKKAYRMHAVIIACIYFSLVIPAYSLSSANALTIILRQEGSLWDNYSKGVVFSGTPFTEMELREINARIKSGSWEISTRAECILPNGKNVIVKGNTLPSAGHLNEKLSELEKDECIISRQLAEGENLKKGDTIRIKSKDLKVHDIYTQIYPSDSIFIDYRTSRTLFKSTAIQQDFYYDEAADAIVRGFVNRKSVQMDELDAGTVSDDSFYFGLKMVGARLAVGVLALFIGILSSVSLMFSETRRRIGEYGIRLAFGMTRLELFINIVRNYLLDTIIAVALILLSLGSVSKFLDLNKEMHIDAHVIFAIVIIGIASNLTVTLLIEKRITKMSITQLLKSGGRLC